MKIDFTPLVRPHFIKVASRTDSWHSRTEEIQTEVLRSLLKQAQATEYGKNYGFSQILKSSDIVAAYRDNVPMIEYEDIRKLVLKMVVGVSNVLWPGVCNNYAQSSGTSGGKSKYIPITDRYLHFNHYQGGMDSVAHYLRQVPESRLFSGKGFILGGSFANSLRFSRPGLHVGDLSATLIQRINPLVNMVRVPDKKTALLPDWETKLPALIKSASHADITNISGVPSWFLTVLNGIMEDRKVKNIHEIWPNLEVFFHGGISFEPYRDTYQKFTDPSKMHFLETYNASEGFFAVQNDFSDPAMLLIIDSDIFFEFLPLDGSSNTPLTASELSPGSVYELIISSSNGLWRYRLGDTIRVSQNNPLKITVAGRTKSFINAFGEELMEDNAERAIASACDRTGASILNYTAAPMFAHDGKRGRHQWLIEWDVKPDNMLAFARILDEELCKLNSDYDAKRAHTIFLDPPELISASRGLFDRWLKSAGSHKLGGQRKVPRLSNNRTLFETLLTFM